MAPQFDWDQFQDDKAAAAPGAGAGSKFNWDSFSDDPIANKPGFFDGIAKSAIDSLPMVGGVAGGILGTPADALTGPAGTIGGAAIGGYLGTATKNLINRYYDPKSAPQTTADAITQPITGGVVQGLAQATGDAVAPYLVKGVQSVTSPVADAFKSFAARKAIAATGATGAQAAKFAPDAGQALLDRGIVGFGDSQAAVAQKATDALNQAGENIGNIISDLDKKGVTVNQSDIVDALRKRASNLGKDPSQFGVSDSLNRTADRIQAMIDANGGASAVPISEAEATKKGFQASANYNSSAADLTHAKESASIYRQAVEDAATKADPAVGEAFKNEKETYKLLTPMQEAAQKRALTVSQSPHGGLMDTVATIAGEGIAGIPGAIAAPMIRRTVASRIPSTLAGTANYAGSILSSAPAAAEAAAPVAAPIAARAFSKPIATATTDAGSALLPIPAAAQYNQPGQSPAAGPDHWAQSGLKNLGIQNAKTASAILGDPQGKQLLFQASMLKPGSPAIQKIMSQIRQNWGNQ